MPQGRCTHGAPKAPRSSLVFIDERFTLLESDPAGLPDERTRVGW